MRDLIIIFVLLFIFVLVFSSKGKNILYKPIEPQTIYDAEVSSYTAVQTVFSVELSKSNLPTYNVYSELYLPERFVANVVKAKSQADYIILTSDLLERKFVFIPPQKQQYTDTSTTQVKTERKQIQKKDVKTKSEQAETQEEKQEAQHTQDTQYELNFRDIKEYVKKSLKTYFYPGLSTTNKDVIVSLISYTPYPDNQGVIKFKIENNQKSFFFINRIELHTKSEKLPIKIFSEQFVNPTSELEGFVLFPVKLPEKEYNFLVSDGKNTYKLQFKIP